MKSILKGLLLVASMLCMASCGNKPAPTTSQTTTTVPPTPVTYTVTWVNADGTVLEKDTGLLAGETPTYDGETPVQEVADEDYAKVAYYTFKGWDKEVVAVTEDTTYTATYTTTTTKEVCYNEAYRISGYWEGTVTEAYWDVYGLMLTGANFGLNYTLQQLMDYCDTLFLKGYTAVVPFEYDEKTNQWNATYLAQAKELVTFVVVYESTYIDPTTQTEKQGNAIQFQVTHMHLLAA